MRCFPLVRDSPKPLPPELSMKARRTFAIVTVVFVMVFAASAFGSASNIYITQNGAPSGNCTSNVQTPAFFNNAANWGTGANQIGPGTTVLLCGTFTFPAGGTGFTAQGSGASGSPVVIRFDTGAILQAPYFGGSPCASFGGGIVAYNKNYLLIDGQNSGIIQNTANGTSLANHQSSVGIYIGAGTGIEVRGLTVQNIYANQGRTPSATDVGGEFTVDIVTSGSQNSINIHDNIFNNARTGWNACWAGNAINGLTFKNNTLADHGWHISGGAAAGTSLSNVVIDGNDFSNWDNWQYPSGTYHTDGIIAYTNSATEVPLTISNNYFHTNLGNGSASSFIACGAGANCTVFNNLELADNHTTYPAGPPVGCSFFSSSQDTAQVHALYNNTAVCTNPGAIAVIAAGSNFTAQNNIFSGFTQAYYSYNSANFATFSDYNDWYNMQSATFASFQGGASYTYAQWRALSGSPDSHSTTGNPLLSSNAIPQSGSSAIGVGTNLTPLGLAALDVDRAGVTRPVSSSPNPAWDLGAYQDPPTQPPTNLMAIVQ